MSTNSVSAPGLADRFDGRDERVGHRHHGVAAAHARRHQRETQRVGAAADADAVFGPAILRELALEGLHLRPADERGGAQGLAESLHELLFELEVTGDQIEKRNRFAIHRFVLCENRL